MTRAAFALLALVAAAPLARADDTPIYVASQAPFQYPSAIAPDIVDDCALPERQIAEIVKAAKAQRVDVVVNDAAVAEGKGRVLAIQIADALEGADPFGSREIALWGRLSQDGAPVAGFYARRGSWKSWWAGRFTTCSVFHFCQESLGRDIAQWLRAPRDGAQLGGH